MLIVATAADAKQGFYDRMGRQLDAAGIPLVYHELKPFTWAAIVRWERDFAAKHENDIVCFVDAWDFLFQGTHRDIVSALGDSDILFHSEACCWPEPHKADFYRPAPTRFRYVNGTGPCGYGAAIVDAIDYGLAHFPIRGEESFIFADNDQRFWTDVFLAGYGRIDYDCKLSVSMNAVEPKDFTIVDSHLRLSSGIQPAFVHANGSSKVRYKAEMEMIK